MMARPLLASLAAPLLTAALLAACDPPKALPGDEFLGEFRFTSVVRVRSTDECPANPDAGFEGAEVQRLDAFSAQVSRCSRGGATTACTDGGVTFFTVNGVDRRATFDGQRLVVSATEVPRTFTACGTCEASGAEPGSRLREDLDLVLYSSSQWQAAGQSCDGGVPAVDADGGGAPPAHGDGGFDAVAACGALNERILAPARCACVPEKIPETGCTMVFSLAAERK